MKYLYGANVQGIQEFIFETGKLKEMIGGSEIVEQICKDSFDDFLKSKEIFSGNSQWITRAAGKIRLIGEEEEVKTIVKYFPKFVAGKFPGIMLQEAVVPLTGNLTKKELNDLEDKLNIQRNLVSRPSQIGLAASVRAPRTGRPACERQRDKDKSELIDQQTKIKQENGVENAAERLAKKLLGDKPFLEKNGKKVRFPFDFREIVRGKESWLAVIHADGNSLGKRLKELANKSQNLAKELREFSENLDKATCEAARNAFEKAIHLKMTSGSKFFPFRPLILGGDDLTVICRADLAIDFTQIFLKEFEIQTKKELSLNQGLTACAGIAFIKESYPFHYGYELAEKLCGQAKKRSKNINPDHIPSSLAFYKIQSSFCDDYEQIQRELTISFDQNKSSDQSKIELTLGAYTTEANLKMPTISNLRKCLEILKKKEAPKSGLRQWLTELRNDRESAKQLLRRVVQIANERWADRKAFDTALSALETGLSLENLMIEKSEDKKSVTPVYDMLTLLSVEGDEQNG